MSAEREVINITKNRTQSIRDLPPEQRRARIATILDRGVVGVRLDVELPKGVYGEWVANDAESIFRMETLGFQVDLEYAKNRALHNDGTDKAIVGDVVFMTCPQEVKDEIEMVRTMKYNTANKKRVGLPEENVVNQIQNSGLPVTNNSSQDFVKTSEIVSAIKES